MKLAAAEAKALKFVLLVIVLAALARYLRRAEPIHIEQAVVPELGTPSARPKGQTARRPAGPLNPNTATIPELDALPGIGDVTARRIVAGRPYHTQDDLARVIGRKRMTTLAPRFTLPPAPPALSIDPPAAARESRPSAAPTVILLNRATMAELETVPGVGPALARRIVAARDSAGGFRDWSQVDAISGVGPALLAKLKSKTRL